jgi:ribonuclease-3
VNNPILKLSQRVGYKFQNECLLQEALTHCSFGSVNNERLEFLGDSIVNFIIAEQLFARFPDASEGQLTRLRAKLVRGKTLALLAKEFDLGQFLKMGAGELKSGGFRRDSVLADGLEALIGAIYLDSGLDVCRERVLCWYGKRLQELDPEADVKDAKTKLQEFMQAKGLSLPVYEVVSITGQTHDQHFTVVCRIKSPECEHKGEGNSRRLAEQAAAERALRSIANVTS